MYVKQCDCLKSLACGRPDKFDPLYIFQDKMQFQIFKKIFYLKILCAPLITQQLAAGPV
jgi:hypothetical protein